MFHYRLGTPGMPDKPVAWIDHSVEALETRNGSTTSSSNCHHDMLTEARCDPVVGSGSSTKLRRRDGSSRTPG